MQNFVNAVTLNSYYTKTQVDSADNVVRSSIHDSVLTIKRNGELVGTFSANQNTNQTINILVPTKVKDLENDAKFLTSDSAIVKTMRDSIRINANKIHSDSTDLAAKMRTDSTDLAAKLRSDSANLVAKMRSDSTILAAKMRSDSTIVMDTLHNYYATKKALTDSVAALRVVEKSKIFIVQTDQGEGPKVELCTLDNVPNESYRVKLYINGVLVGDDFKDNNNTDFTPVLSKDPTNKRKIIYDSAKNENYKLKAGDKIILYWFE